MKQAPATQSPVRSGPGASQLHGHLGGGGPGQQVRQRQEVDEGALVHPGAAAHQLLAHQRKVRQRSAKGGGAQAEEDGGHLGQPAPGRAVVGTGRQGRHGRALSPQLHQHIKERPGHTRWCATVASFRTWRGSRPRVVPATKCLSCSTSRRGRDSNPRYPFRYTRVPGVRLQPLGHLSRKMSRLQGMPPVAFPWGRRRPLFS